MSYASGEAALLTLIQSLAAWDSQNSISLANDASGKGDTLLTDGKARRYCILRPGAFNHQPLDIGRSLHETRWVTICGLYVLKGNSTGESPEKTLSADRQAIIEKIDAYYRLNASGTVNEALVVSGEPIENDARAGKRRFVMQELMIEWVETNSATQND